MTKTNMIKLEKTEMAVMKKATKTIKKKTSVYIPGDVFSEILLRLPARSLGKFRCVSKSWLSITSNTAFARANAQINRITRLSAILENLTRPTNICSDSGDANSESAANGLCEIQLPTKCIPDYSHLVASCDGLVCLMKATYYSIINWYVINPLTGQSFAMPINIVDASHNPGFYFHRSTSKYRLIRIRNFNSMGATEVLVVGESSWRRIPGNLPAFSHCRNPLDLNGNIYWLASSRRGISSHDTVVIFDQEQEVYGVISVPPSLQKLHDYGRNLVDLNGELGLLVVGKNNTMDVWIMEENSWIKRYSVNYAHIHGCSSLLMSWWTLSGAVIIRDEELLVKMSCSCPCATILYSKPPHFLVRCNLKSGACVAQQIMGTRSDIYDSIFSYTETLTSSE